jgi:hypothetical protein
MVLGTAALASPVRQLEMQMHGPHPDLPNQILWGDFENETLETVFNMFTHW